MGSLNTDGGVAVVTLPVETMACLLDKPENYNSHEHLGLGQRNLPQ
jgi:hypothetical protein